MAYQCLTSGRMSSAKLAWLTVPVYNPSLVIPNKQEQMKVTQYVNYHHYNLIGLSYNYPMTGQSINW